MKYFSFVLLTFIFTNFVWNIPPLQKSESRLIEYPVPFYYWNNTIENLVFYGIETAKFIYVRNGKNAWLLYDKRIESSQWINVVNLDEYIFIQSDLESQIQKLLKIRKHNCQFINLQLHPWGNYNCTISE